MTMLNKARLTRYGMYSFIQDNLKILSINVLNLQLKMEKSAKQKGKALLPPGTKP